MAKRDDEDKDAPAKGGKKKSPLVLILMAVLLLGAGTAGTLYFMGMLPTGGGEDAAEEDATNDSANNKEPIYFAFEQPFTVNFETESGLRFLQVSVELMSYDPEAIEAIQTHMPVIKNNIILMFSNQGYDDLISREGKDKLRESTLQEIEGALKKYHGKGGIEEVYFTSFVIQ